MKTKKVSRLFMIVLFCITLISIGCKGKNETGPSVSNISNGPWVGNWIQVNFLGDHMDGWGPINPNGIGYVAKITESEWIETNKYDSNYIASYSYTVDSNNKYSKKTKSCSNYSFESR